MELGLDRPWVVKDPTTAAATPTAADPAVASGRGVRLLLFVPGHISAQLDSVDFGRAYVILESAVAVKRFGDDLRGATFEAAAKLPAGGGR